MVIEVSCPGANQASREESQLAVRNERPESLARRSEVLRSRYPQEFPPQIRALILSMMMWQSKCTSNSILFLFLLTTAHPVQLRPQHIDYFVRLRDVVHLNARRGPSLNNSCKYPAIQFALRRRAGHEPGHHPHLLNGKGSRVGLPLFTRHSLRLTLTTARAIHIPSRIARIIRRELHVNRRQLCRLPRPLQRIIRAKVLEVLYRRAA